MEALKMAQLRLRALKVKHMPRLNKSMNACMVADLLREQLLVSP